MGEKLAIEGGSPVFERVIGYGRQDISDEDVEAVVRTLKSDYLTCGPAVEEFEERLKEVTGAKYVTSVANGTAALHVACLAAGVQPGDAAIVSPITFAASANCVRYCGGTPYFADIDPKTWNIDPDKVEQMLPEHLKVVVAVDFGGVPVAADRLREWCHRHGALLIEDAAHSLGSSVGGRPVGSLADITTFSFHPVKTVTTCEGGAVATDDPELAKKIELYSKHGITRRLEWLGEPDVGGWWYEQQVLGYNYRLSDVQAALGSSQLGRLPEFAARRREIVARYNEAFSDFPEVSFQHDPHPEETVRHLYCLRFDTEALDTSRRWIYDALRAEGLGVNVHYIPVYRLPYYQDAQQPGYARATCPEADAYYEQAITLPLHTCLTDEDVEGVIRAVRKVVDACHEGRA